MDCKMNFSDFEKNFSFDELAGNMYKITGYKGKSKEVIIPSEVDVPHYSEPYKVRDVGMFAFAGNYTITSVKISEGIRFIGVGAFKDCINLSKIELPQNKLVTIDAQAFIGTSYYNNMNNWELEGVYNSLYLGNALICVMPNANFGISSIYYSVREDTKIIASEAFSQVKDTLKWVDIPKSVTDINQGAFCDCEKLIEVVGGQGIKRLGFYVFCNTGLEKINFLDEVSILGEYTFSKCKAKTLVLSKINNCFTEENKAFKDTDISTVYINGEEWCIPDEEFLYWLLEAKKENTYP